MVSSLLGKYLPVQTVFKLKKEALEKVMKHAQG